MASAPPPSPPPPPNEKRESIRFWIEVLGLVAVVITIIITLITNASNGDDMAKAIGQMESIAQTMQNEQDDITNQASATVAFAQETKKLAASSKAQAEAAANTARSTQVAAKIARQQADVAFRQLEMEQAAKVDVDIRLTAYGSDFVQVAGIIENRGKTTVHGTLYGARTGVYTGVPLQRVWNEALEPMKISVVPGIPHNIPLRIQVGDPQRWDDIVQGRASAVFAIRFVFKDAAGKTQQIQQCLAVNGPPENAYPINC